MITKSTFSVQDFTKKSLLEVTYRFFLVYNRSQKDYWKNRWKCNISQTTKACFRYFLYFTKRKSLKIMENAYISPKLLFPIFKVLLISSFLPNVLKFQKVENVIVTSWIGLHKISIVIFGITQKPLLIKASQLAR